MTTTDVGPHDIVVGEWWIPAGPHAEIAVYEPLHAAELVCALTAELRARQKALHLNRIDDDALPALILGADNLGALSEAWRQLAADHDGIAARLNALDPLAGWTSLADHGAEVGIVLTLGIPAAPRPAPPATHLPNAMASAHRPTRPITASTTSVWRTTAAATRAVLVLPGDLTTCRTAVYSTELQAFIEDLATVPARQRN